MQTTEFSFTAMQLINAIAFWKLEPLTSQEITYLLQRFAPDADNASFTYGQDDIESYILECLSDMDNIEDCLDISPSGEPC